MHQRKAQVHVYGCNWLHVTSPTHVARFTVLTDCPIFPYYHALTSLAPNITDILWVSVPHILTTRYNTVLADVNSLDEWSRVTWYSIYCDVQWNMSQQIRTLSGHINDTRNSYLAFLWNALRNTNVQQQSKVIVSMIMCSKVTMSMAVAFNVWSHTLILNWMHDMHMCLPKVLYDDWYWFEVALLILNQMFVLCVIV